MIRKAISFVGLFFVALLALALPAVSKAEGFYAYAMHGSCITYGWTNNGVGSISHYDWKTGHSYSGIVTAIVLTGPNSGVVYSQGFVDGVEQAVDADVFGPDQSNSPSVADAISGEALIGGSDAIWYGSEFIW